MERVPTGAYLDFAVSSLSNRVSLIRHQLAMLTKRFYILQLALACFYQQAILYCVRQGIPCVCLAEMSSAESGGILSCPSVEL